MPDFLLEIGTEEIPARMIATGAQELGNNIALSAHQAVLSNKTQGNYAWTPRRLIVQLPNLFTQQPDVERDEIGPSFKIAFKDGVPTAAAEAFAKKQGVPVSSLKRLTTSKGDYVGVHTIRKGAAAADVLKEIVEDELHQLSWEKTMYWRGKSTERFVRPVRWIVALLGDEVLPIEFAGVVASRKSRGHRTLSSMQFSVPSSQFSDYLNDLKASKVLANPVEREQQIREDLDAATRTISGARWREDKSLLETVVNLTEWPSVVLGSFDREYLQLPEEVLVTVMRDHQKYFALEDVKGKLLPNFLTVLNTDGDPQGLIRHGNERVLRARFNDARFFWQTDQKQPLRERVCRLKSVTFQKDLGSYYDKTMRVQRLCSWTCELIRDAGMQVRPGVVHKAVCLAKTDLTTELVKEFTELQGIVGGLYARVQVLDHGMPDETRQAIAQTIYDQYKPQSAEDSVPRKIEGAVLSIADKADTIAGMFALGLQPTGSKDPFALRRQANGIVRIIAEHKLPVGIARLFELARETYKGGEGEKKFARGVDYEASLRAFFRERLEFYLKDQLGYKYDVVNAVLAAGADDVVDAVARAEAVSKVRGSQDFESISIASKRIKNILRQANDDGKRVGSEVDGNLFHDEAEKNLGKLVPEIAQAVNDFKQAKEYSRALAEISRIRPAVDAFFDKVMVMVEDEQLRANRLALLQTLLREFSTIADFSEIVTEGKS